MSSTSTQIRTEVRQLRLRLRPYQLGTPEDSEAENAPPEVASSEITTPDVDTAEAERSNIDKIDKSGIVAPPANNAEASNAATQVAPRRPQSLIRRIISTPFGSWVELGLGLYVIVSFGKAVGGLADYFLQPQTVDNACFCQQAAWRTCPPGFSMQLLRFDEVNVAKCVSDLSWAFNQGQGVTWILLRAVGAGAGLALLRRARDAGASFPWNPLRIGARPSRAWDENDLCDGVVRRAPIRRHHFNLQALPYYLGVFMLIALAQIGILFWRMFTAIPPDAPYPTCEEGTGGWWVASFIGTGARCYSSQDMTDNMISSVGLALLVLPIAWLAAVLLHEDNNAMQWQFSHPGDNPDS